MAYPSPRLGRCHSHHLARCFRRHSKGKLNPALLGIALVNMMNLGLNLKGIILAWSQLETSLGAVTRIKTFEETTPSELLPHEDYTPPEEWPSQGSLEFIDLSVQYEYV